MRSKVFDISDKLIGKDKDASKLHIRVQPILVVIHIFNGGRFILIPPPFRLVIYCLTETPSTR